MERHPLDNVADLLDLAINKSFELQRDLDELKVAEFHLLRKLHDLRRVYIPVTKED